MCINVNCVLQYELLAKLINDYIPETDLADIFFSNINNNTASELNGYNPSYFLFYCENLKKIKFMTKHLDNTSELQNVINIFCEKLKLGNELLPQVKVKNSNHNMTDLRGLSHCRLIELSTSDSEQIDVKKLGDGEISYSYLVDYRSDIMKIFTSEGFNYSKYSNLNQMYQHYSLSLASIIDEKSQIKDVNLENNYDFLLKIIDKWQKFDKESRLFELFENSSNLTKDLFKYTHMQIENYNKTFDDVLSAVVKTLKNLKTEYATIDTLLDKDLKNFLQFKILIISKRLEMFLSRVASSNFVSEKWTLDEMYSLAFMSDFLLLKSNADKLLLLGEFDFSNFGCWDEIIKNYQDNLQSLIDFELKLVDPVKSIVNKECLNLKKEYQNIIKELQVLNTNSAAPDLLQLLEEIHLFTKLMVTDYYPIHRSKIIPLDEAKKDCSGLRELITDLNAFVECNKLGDIISSKILNVSKKGEEYAKFIANKFELNKL